MKSLNHCLLAAACVLLPVFSASRCTAQDTDRLLHAGMLGLTVDEEPEGAKAPLAIGGPIFAQELQASPVAELAGFHEGAAVKSDSE